MPRIEVGARQTNGTEVCWVWQVWVENGKRNANAARRYMSKVHCMAVHPLRTLLSVRRALAVYGHGAGVAK